MMNPSSNLHCDHVFDIETYNWDQFVAGGVYTPSTSEYTEIWDESEFFHHLQTLEGQIWTWNGGLYDTLWYAQQVAEAELPARISAAGTRITRLEDGGRVIRDGCALVPMSLRDAAGIGGTSLGKSETGLACVCGGECGGYCSIRPAPEMRSEDRRSLGEYLHNDCVVVAAILHGLSDHAEKENYILKGTVGASAWATAKEWLGLPNAEWDSPGHYHFARRGYYGGRVTVARPTMGTGHRYDINSAYPFALTKVSLPYGPGYICSRETAAKAFEKGFEGIYRAVAKVPDMFLPPLPFRDKRGRVVYPTGEVRGVWTGIELRYAAELGVEIDILMGMVWLKAEPFMAPFTKSVYDTRARVGKDHAIGIWQKWFGNSYTGKLAQSPEMERMLLNPDPQEIQCCPANDFCGGESHQWKCARKCKKWTGLDPGGRLFTVPFYRIPECGHVHQAAYLTAYTRVKLHKAAMLLGDRFGYCDTDSIYAMGELPADMIGEELGSWNYDGPMEQFTAGGPKNYSFWAPDKAKWKSKAKGLSGKHGRNIAREQWLEFANGQPIKMDRGVMGLKSAAKTGGSFFQRKDMTRRNKSDGVWFGDRKADGQTTRPCTLRELADAGRVVL